MENFVQSTKKRFKLWSTITAPKILDPQLKKSRDEALKAENDKLLKEQIHLTAVALINALKLGSNQNAAE